MSDDVSMETVLIYVHYQERERLSFQFLLCLFIFVVLGIETRASQMLGKCSTELQPQP
jgi:hypothetical protein